MVPQHLGVSGRCWYLYCGRGLQRDSVGAIVTASHRLQANLNTLSDDELREFLFYNYHRIKDIEATRQNDARILRLREQLKEAEGGYVNETKECVRNVKAARAVAEVRGLKFDGMEGK